MISERENPGLMRRFSLMFAALAACTFIILAAYRIQLPGLYYDEVNFVNAAQGAHDNTFIYAKLGPIPLLIMPYLGALKAWIYAPILYFLKVSPLTIRLPAILLAAVTLLILHCAMLDIWFVLDFAVGISVCYPDSILTFWRSLSRSARWLVIITMLVGFGFHDTPDSASSFFLAAAERRHHTP